MIRRVLLLFNAILKRKMPGIKQLENKNIGANEENVGAKDSHIFAKKLIVNISASPPLILERVYICTVPVKIAGIDYISLETINSGTARHESYCINREAIVLIEK